MTEFGIGLRNASFTRVQALIEAVKQDVSGAMIVSTLYPGDEGQMHLIQDIATTNTILRILTKTFVILHGGNPDETYTSRQPDSEDNASGGVPD